MMVIRKGSLTASESADSNRSRKTPVYRLVSAAFLALGLVGAVYSYTLSLGAPSQPGAGFWPFINSCVVVLASIALFVTERTGEQYERFTRRARFVGYGALSIVAFILLFQLLGFMIPALLTFAFWLRFLGEESWPITVTLAVLFTAGLYVIFVLLIGVPFPEDVLEALWDS